MPYAEPIRGLSPDDCSCYHRSPYPEFAERTDWQWDLIGREAEYFGGFDFCGKRVLEFGAADGFLSFWMESRGAEVVCIDLPPDSDGVTWDIRAHVNDDLRQIKKNLSIMMRRLNNAW